MLQAYHWVLACAVKGSIKKYYKAHSAHLSNTVIAFSWRILKHFKGCKMEESSSVYSTVHYHRGMYFSVTSTSCFQKRTLKSTFFRLKRPGFGESVTLVLLFVNLGTHWWIPAHRTHSLLILCIIFYFYEICFSPQETKTWNNQTIKRTKEVQFRT